MAVPDLMNDDDDEEPTENESTENESTDAADNPVADEEVAEGVSTDDPDDEADEEEEPVEEVDMPEDDEEMDEGEGGSLLSGTTFGLSNKLLLGLGLGAVALVLVLRWINAQSARKNDAATEEESREVVEEASDGEANMGQQGARAPNSDFDEQQQEQAIGTVFE